MLACVDVLLKVSGHHNENQILISIQRYFDRKNALSFCLNHLFQLFRYSTVSNHCAALEVGCVYFTFISVKTKKKPTNINTVKYMFTSHVIRIRGNSTWVPVKCETI